MPSNDNGSDYLRALFAQHRGRHAPTPDRIFGRSREDEEIATALLADAEAAERKAQEKTDTEGVADDDQEGDGDDAA